MPIFLARQFRSAEMINDVAEKTWAGGEIKKVIPLGVARLVDLSQGLPNSGVEFRIMKFPAHLKDPLDHPIVKFGIDLARRKLIKIVAHDLLILFTAVIVAANSDDREVRREQLALDQVIDGREELTRSKIARAPKNDHHARTCRRWRA